MDKIMRNAIFLAFMFSLMSGSLVAVSDEVTYPCGYYKRPTAETASQTCIADENGGCNVTQYYASGQVQQICPMKYGKESGKELFYQEDPYSISYEQSWLDGKKEGAFIVYFPDGTILHKSNYKNDKASGKSTDFRKDGSISGSGYYREGWKDGTWAVHSGGNKYITCFSLGDQLVKSTGFWGDKCKNTNRVLESREEMAVRLCKTRINRDSLVRMRVWPPDVPAPDSCYPQDKAEPSSPASTNNILKEDINKDSENDLESTLKYLKSECEKLGYDRGTKQHGDCVLKLLDKS